MKRIIYKNSVGGVSVIIPSPYIPMTIEQIALKDVPFGLPFKIVDTTSIPADRTLRNAWDIDESELIDGVGADYEVLE